MLHTGLVRGVPVVVIRGVIAAMVMVAGAFNKRRSVVSSAGSGRSTFIVAIPEEILSLDSGIVGRTDVASVVATVASTETEFRDGAGVATVPMTTKLER